MTDAVTRDMIRQQVKKAIKETGVKKYVFHNYRNTAFTRWARENVPVDGAMRASGHSSIQMHKRYTDPQDKDMAKAFGTAQAS